MSRIFRRSAVMIKAVISGTIALALVSGAFAAQCSVLSECARRFRMRMAADLELYSENTEVH